VRAVLNNYVILTPAFNEAKYIGATIDSVVCQTVRPLLWVIVDDGSTDETANIVKRYASEHAFIRYQCRAKPLGQLYFVSNVNAIMEGYGLVKKSFAEYVAILDADITLPRNYYERLFLQFKSDPKLGVASGIYQNQVEGKLQEVLSDRRSTPKAIMVFRREVFEAIGGFLPLRYGGEDTAACIMARMGGWKTWSFPDIKAIHHRPTGLGNSKGLLRARYVQGRADYGIGSHPLFVIGKSVRRMIKEPPFLAGGLARMAGYLTGLVRDRDRGVPEEVIRFYRNEQIERILGANGVPDKLRPTVQGDSVLEDQSPSGEAGSREAV